MAGGGYALRDVECGQCDARFSTFTVSRGEELRVQYCPKCGCQALRKSVRVRLEAKEEATT